MVLEDLLTGAMVMRWRWWWWWWCWRLRDYF